MSILDGILGGGDNQSSSLDLGFGTDPQLGANLSDVLDFTSSDNGSGFGDSSGGGDFTHLTGIGDASIGFAAPTFLGVSASQQSSDDSGNSGNSDNGGNNDGGLLNGLL